MRFRKLMIAGALTCMTLASMSSCGSWLDKINEAKLDGTPEDLPYATVIAIPRDAAGEELVGKAELRVIPNSQTDISEKDLPAVYQQASKPDQVLTKEQVEQSTQSTKGWQSPTQCATQTSSHQEVGCSEQVIGSCCVRYEVYRPTYVYYGRPYHWIFHRMHRTSTMNFYYYRQVTIEKQVAEKTKSKSNQKFAEESQSQQDQQQQQQETQSEQSSVRTGYC